MPKSPKLPPTETEIALNAARKALHVLENGHVATGIHRDRTSEIAWAERSLTEPFSWEKPGVVRNRIAYHKIMHEAWQAQLTFLRERIAQLEQQQHAALLNVLSDH